MKLKIFLLIILSVLVLNTTSGQKSNKKFTVSGLVTDSSLKPVAGAMILVDNKKTSATTDFNGVYKIKVSPGADSITIITFSSGISTAAINGQTNINFILGESAPSQQKINPNAADEQKIDIGYGSVNKADIMSPVNKIDVKNGKYAAYKDIYEILKGTPGLSVVGKSIKIQGPISFNLSSEPLFVVDGVMTESIDEISPALIESITVLKGVSASIYGARGANGVILISLIRSPQFK